MRWFYWLCEQVVAFWRPLSNLDPIDGAPQQIVPAPPEATDLPQEPSLPIDKPTMTNQEKLYQVAKESLGKDMSPQDLAPDSLACMESVNGVYLAAFGEELLPMSARLSTEAGYQAMVQDSRLEKTATPTPGCIVISPTGYSSKGSQHGHTGIWGNFDVMSNDSNSGRWTDNYTHDAWYKVFHDTLGFPVFFFNIKG